MMPSASHNATTSWSSSMRSSVSELSWGVSIPARVSREDGTGKELRAPHDLPHLLLPLDGHDVDPGDPFDPAQLLDDLRADREAGFAALALGGVIHPLDDRFGDDDAGHVLGHVAGHAGRLQGRDSRE